MPKEIVREDRESLTAHRSCCTDTLFPPSLRNIDGAAARGRRQGEFRGAGLAGRASRCATALGDLAGDTSLADLELSDVLVVENNVPVLTCQWAGVGGGTRFKEGKMRTPWDQCTWCCWRRQGPRSSRHASPRPLGAPYQHWTGGRRAWQRLSQPARGLDRTRTASWR